MIGRKKREETQKGMPDAGKLAVEQLGFVGFSRLSEAASPT